MLALLAAMLFSGRVVSCDGSPLPGVTVTSSTNQTMVTGVDGRFAFEADSWEERNCRNSATSRVA